MLLDDAVCGELMRKLKMNLRNAGNIGSENSEADNAFMYSVIESCRHNEIVPGKYISYLLGKLKTSSEGLHTKLLYKRFWPYMLYLIPNLRDTKTDWRILRKRTQETNHSD